MKKLWIKSGTPNFRKPSWKKMTGSAAVALSVTRTRLGGANM